MEGYLTSPNTIAKAIGRGGWCFEHNTLFRHALEALGFSVTSLAARVLWNAPPDSPMGPRSHMLLLVDPRLRAETQRVVFGSPARTRAALTRNR
jgi:arylamine N-acetyltransferase